MHDLAVATPMAKELNPKAVTNGCTTSYAPFFCDYVIQIIRNDPAFGPTTAARQALLDRGGLTIQTTLDPNVQRTAQQAVDAAIPPKDPSRKLAATVIEQPGTGAILGMAENRVWGTSNKVRGETTINYMVDRKYNGSDFGIAAGSTFKPFTMAAALEKHVSVGTVIDATSPKTFTKFKNCTTGAPYPPYSPKNSTQSGKMNMAKAAAYSVNTYFVAIEEQISQCSAASLAAKLGIKGADGKPITDPGPSWTLGTYETTPLDMAEAYATFAARGIHCASRAIISVTDRNGGPLDVPQQDCTQAIPRDVADGVNFLLHGVITGPYPGSTGAPMALAGGRPAAGKTGTIDQHAAVWFVGYTPQVVTAVAVTDPRGGFSHPLTNITINGTYYPEVFGKSIPGPIWKSIMDSILAGRKAPEFVPPDPKIIKGIQVKVPDLTNKTQAEAKVILDKLGLTFTVDPTFINVDPVQYGHIAKSDPPAGTSVGIGSEVTLFLSTGKPPPGSQPSSSPGAGQPSSSPGKSGGPGPSPTPTPSSSGQPQPGASQSP
jgi:membrane peptidoglycan carboxypeptidase